MKNLLPPELRRYYTVKLNSQRMDKDDALAVTENLLINFEAPNPEREMLLMYYRKPTEQETARKVTASMIVARFGGAIRLDERKVGRALKELGYDVIHTRNGNIWLVMERSANEMNDILPEEMVGRTKNREV